MSALQTSLYLFLRDLRDRTDGQDLVEYSLVLSMIAFGCVTGMSSVATGLNTAFSTVASTLTTNV